MIRRLQFAPLALCAQVLHANTDSSTAFNGPPTPRHPTIIPTSATSPVAAAAAAAVDGNRDRDKLSSDITKVMTAGFTFLCTCTVRLAKTKMIPSFCSSTYGIGKVIEVWTWPLESRSGSNMNKERALGARSRKKNFFGKSHK